MSELDRSLTNIDWLISCAKDKQPIKSKSETTHFCGNCLHCSRLRSPSRTPKTPVSQSGSSPGPSSSSSTPNKPAHSYANIIATAIRKSANQRMTLNEIYAAILDTYPYFRNVAAGWKVGLILTHTMDVIILFLELGETQSVTQQNIQKTPKTQRRAREGMSIFSNIL